MTVISSVEYEMGKEYFEVNLRAIHPEAELCIGVAMASVVDNFRAIPAPEYRCAAAVVPAAAVSSNHRSCALCLVPCACTRHISPAVFDQSLEGFRGSGQGMYLCFFFLSTSGNPEPLDLMPKTWP